MVLQNSGKYRADRPEKSDQGEKSDGAPVFRYL